MATLLEQEELALEWSLFKKKEDKKLERKIQPKEYLSKAKSTLQSLLNKPDFKEIKSFIKFKEPSQDQKDKFINGGKYITIGEYFSNARTDDEQIKAGEIMTKWCDEAKDKLDDHSYDIYCEGELKDGSITIKSLI